MLPKFLLSRIHLKNKFTSSIYLHSVKEWKHLPQFPLKPEYKRDFPALPTPKLLSINPLKLSTSSESCLFVYDGQRRCGEKFNFVYSARQRPPN